jgi:hypothetical protein
MTKIPKIEYGEYRRILTVLRCGCDSPYGVSCHRCNDTGSIFWVNGYSFPYDEKGEEQAIHAAKKSFQVEQVVNGSPDDPVRPPWE